MTNEGTLDRLIRIVVGISLLSLTVLGPGTAWGLAGILPLLTGVLGFCPLYLPFGIDTRPRRPSRA
jgi:hypothetical protein